MFHFFRIEISLLFRCFIQAANIADVLGVAKKTPMGIFLREWGIEPNPKFIS